MTRILATGTSGTIGKFLFNQVSAIKGDITSLDSEIQGFGNNLNSNLIHLAGVVGPRNVSNDLEYSHRVNVEATQKLGKWFLEASSGKFLFTSTAHVYKSADAPVSELSQLEPISHYAEQKLHAEDQLRAIFQDSPHRLVICRIFSIVDWRTKPGTLGDLLTRASKDEGIEIRNALDVRDFLAPKQVADTLIKIVHSELFGTVNICSGNGNSIQDIAQKMFRFANLEISDNRFVLENSANPFLVGVNTRLRSAISNFETGNFLSQLSTYSL